MHRHALQRLWEAGARRYEDATAIDNHAMRRVFEANGCQPCGASRLYQLASAPRRSPERPELSWEQHNQRFLLLCLERIRGLLKHHTSTQREAPSWVPTQSSRDDGWPEWTGPEDEPPAVRTLCSQLELTGFERDLLLLCVGVELDRQLATLCAQAHQTAERRYPTLALAITALPGARWSAILPTGALRHWGLITLEPGAAVLHAPLRCDERVWQFLLGLDGPDARLLRYVEALPKDTLAPSHEQIAQLAATACVKLQGSEPPPVIQLHGLGAGDQRGIAVRAALMSGYEVLGLAGERLPVSLEELEYLLLLLRREFLFSHLALIVNCHGLEMSEPARAAAIARLANDSPCPIFLCGPEQRLDVPRDSLTFDVPLPSPQDQREWWSAALQRRFGEQQSAQLELPRAIEALADQFCLNAAEIEASALQAAGQLAILEAPTQEHALRALWESARLQSRRRLDSLAQRLEVKTDGSELVLPEAPRRMLAEIALQVRHRVFVHEQWGFSDQGWRGMGLTALFHGPSGTGKTLAAGVLARQLGLDLYRVDLSSVLSKYIGDTEKALRRIFDAAESGAVVLLFDEADALFGKRSEVKDSHDRYANLAVSYLLQRLESFGGLAILTTNLKSALDAAFIRRLRFIVGFPFPDRPEREELWRRAFPPSTPRAGLDPSRLAQLHLSGASIRNIALHAAFLASEEAKREAATPEVRGIHILEAIRQEFLKLQQPLNPWELETLF